MQCPSFPNNKSKQDQDRHFKRAHHVLHKQRVAFTRDHALVRRMNCHHRRSRYEQRPKEKNQEPDTLMVQEALLSDEVELQEQQDQPDKDRDDVEKVVRTRLRLGT